MYYDLLAKTLSISDGLQGYQVSGTIRGRGGRVPRLPAQLLTIHPTSHRARTPRGRESLLQKPLRGMTGIGLQESVMIQSL